MNILFLLYLMLITPFKLLFFYNYCFFIIILRVNFFIISPFKYYLNINNLVVFCFIGNSCTYFVINSKIF